MKNNIEPKAGRKVEVLKNGVWKEAEMMSLLIGDLFRLTDYGVDDPLENGSKIYKVTALPKILKKGENGNKDIHAVESISVEKE
jgi:hypothetical protein